MKAFAIVVRTLLVTGGLGILVFYPVMIKNISNDGLFQTLSVITRVSVVMAGVGMAGNLVRALLLLFQECSKRRK